MDKSSTPDIIKEEHQISSKTINVNSTTETSIGQFELERARQEKKRDLKSKQYSTYVKSLYGTPVEKEAIRRDQRESLLKQLQEKEQSAKETVRNKVKESEMAVAYDKFCLESDKQQQVSKANYLKQFRDGNKQLIEERSDQKRMQKEEENRKERELLKQNPINWSNTLC